MKVLVVDSEPLVVRTFEKMLAADGHEVSAFLMADSNAAKEVMRLAVESDVVLMGLVLFAADAPILAWRIRELAPAVRIVVSGISRELGEGLVEIGAADAFLPRPFELDELRVALGAGVAQ